MLVLDVLRTRSLQTLAKLPISFSRVKCSQLVVFVEKLKEVIDDQEKEVDKAVINRGKFHFKSEYKHLEVPETKWYKMSASQRKAHLDRITHATVATPHMLDSASSPARASTSIASTPDSMLSVNLNEAASMVCIPKPCLRGIWLKAAELLSVPGSIT